MSGEKSKKPSSLNVVKRDVRTGQFIVKPDVRDFRGGFQPKKTSSCMPKLPTSGSAIRKIQIDYTKIGINKTKAKG